MENNDEDYSFSSRPATRSTNIDMADSGEKIETFDIEKNESTGGDVQDFLKEQESKPDQRNDRAQKDMIYGALWCIGGLAITAISYQMASSGSGGGRYFLAFGPVIYGAVTFFKGVANYRS